MKQDALVPDDLWAAIEPFLPKEPPKPKGGRPRVSDRAALAGIVFVLKTGIPWQMLPTELGCGSGSTCWRRLRDWQEAGVWERLHERFLNWLGDEAAIDWSRASLDSISVRAKRGASRPAPTRSTGARPAPSTTSWWIATASRSRCVFRRLIPTTRPSCCPSSYGNCIRPVSTTSPTSPSCSRCRARRCTGCWNEERPPTRRRANPCRGWADHAAVRIEKGRIGAAAGRIRGRPR
jgi:transposase